MFVPLRRFKFACLAFEIFVSVRVFLLLCRLSLSNFTCQEESRKQIADINGKAENVAFYT